jgi:imidazole glycerol phosphate synthase subunit HisF
MTEAFAKQIETEARQAMTELVAAAKLKKGDVLVVGCSSSEMVGGHIGKDSSIEAARALYAGAAPVLAEKGIWLAAQCCEHLNRALVVEREMMEAYALEEVCVHPVEQAGGAREQQLEVVVELRHRAHRRARGAHRVGLVDGDGRRHAFDCVHRRAVHAVEELARVGAEGLDVTALSFGVQRVEDQRRLAAVLENLLL